MICNNKSEILSIISNIFFVICTFPKNTYTATLMHQFSFCKMKSLRMLIFPVSQIFTNTKISTYSTYISNHALGILTKDS